MTSFSCFKLCVSVLSIISIVACSDGDAGNNLTDSRSSINTFLQNNPQSESQIFTDEFHDNIKSSANQASISFTHYAMNNSDQNSIVVPWPMLSTLPLITLSAHGETYDEVMMGLSDFNLEHGWSSAIGVFQNKLSVLAESVATQLEHSFWWQEDSLFEDEFLSKIDSSLNPKHIVNNFKTDGFIYENINDEIDQMYGASYPWYWFDGYDNTRLVALNQIKAHGKFDLVGFQSEVFEGIFSSYYHFTKASMLRLQGNFKNYESTDLSAHKIPLAGGYLSLISIQPKEDMKAYVLENLGTILNELGSSWVLKETSVVLPIMSVEFQIHEEDWLQWKEIDLIYSSDNSDLRSMDHMGGLYMQSMPYLNRIDISEQGIEVAGVSGKTITFDENNLSHLPDPPEGLVITVPEVPEPLLFECNELEVSLVPGFFILMDEVNGIIQAVVNLNLVDGSPVELLEGSC